MKTVLRILLLSLVAPAVLAQENPLSAHNKMMYSVLKRILVRSAEQMPEEHYAFKPVDTVRSFGQIVGHIADSQYTFCSAALGEKRPVLKIEQTKTTKAELISALKEALAYCDKAYDGMTDAEGVEMVTLMRSDTPKLGVLTINSVHNTEHYGNLVTYLRMKGIVPPTSEPGFLSPPKK